MLTTICLLLFAGAIGKSAQLPLYVWLPDAMEGPTPVSALIHAATMVTAGVYMVARMNPLFSQRASRHAGRRHRRRGHRVLFRHHRPGADRHQESSRVLDRLAARLHVSGLRRGRVRRGHIPSDDARLLQGTALPRRRQRDPRHGRRAGHDEDGRPAQEDSRSPTGRCSSARWPSPVFRALPDSSARTKFSKPPKTARTRT